MRKILLKLFVKNYTDTKNQEVRTKYGSLAGLVGIISNLLLAAFKIIVGLISLSSALVGDGINNLSDSFSSIVTLIGFKLSNKEADDDHPFGHQRIEYIAGLIVSFIILIIGLSLAKTSVEGIIDLIKNEATPLNVDQPVLIFLCLIISILVKLWQSLFYKNMGNDVDSQALIANSKDSLNDCITTLAVLISTIIYLSTNGKVNIDSIAGLVVAGFVIITAIGLIIETVNPLLGVVPSEEQIKEITDMVYSYDGVLGIHDLVYHSYGPNMNYVTLHCEVSREVDVMLSHDMIDNIEHDVRVKLGIDLTIHMDPIEVHDELTNEIRAIVAAILNEVDPIITYHDLRVVPGPTHTNVLFDVVIPTVYKMKPKELRELITKKLKDYDETYNAVIQVDQFYNRITD